MTLKCTKFKCNVVWIDMLCTGYNTMSTKLVLEKNMKVWKDTSILGWQVIMKAHLSFQLK